MYELCPPIVVAKHAAGKIVVLIDKCHNEIEAIYGEIKDVVGTCDDQNTLLESLQDYMACCLDGNPDDVVGRVRIAQAAAIHLNAHLPKISNPQAFVDLFKIYQVDLRGDCRYGFHVVTTEETGFYFIGTNELETIESRVAGYIDPYS